MRILIIGNAGSGKTTMARKLAAESQPQHTPILSLDDIAWDENTQRRPIKHSTAALDDFIAANPHWIIEGCYADLAAHILQHCTELRFLNPGVETCVIRCKARPWEPDKFKTPQAQQDALAYLIDWVRDYETRTDEFGHASHRRLFDQFTGPKREYTSNTNNADDNLAQ